MRCALKFVACLILLGPALCAGEPTTVDLFDQKDELCRTLYETYIFPRVHKVNSSTIQAATHIVAERGRENGFWKIVLKDLQKNQNDTSRCVLVLGKMLAIDAAARDRIKSEKETGIQGAWFASVCLSPEVVQELITRGKAADRFRIDSYAVALRQARVPEATEFLRSILRNETGKNYMHDAQFQAAVGLAQVGESDGYEWLIKHCEEKLSSGQMALPRWVSNNNLGNCAVAALRDLSGNQALSTRNEFQTWWNTVDKTTLPKNYVRMNDEY